MSETTTPSFRWLTLTTMLVVSAITYIFIIRVSHLSIQLVFIAIIIFSISLAVASILGGTLLDKFGVMKVYIVGLIIIGIGALLTPFIGSSSGGMIFIRILHGLGTGPIIVSAVPIAARYFPLKLRSFIIALQGLAFLLGIRIGIFLISRIFQATQNLQTIMAWLAPICILGLIFSFIAASSEKKLEEEISKTKTLFKKDIITSLLKPVTWVVIACLAIYVSIEDSIYNIVPLYLSTAPPRVGLGYDYDAHIVASLNLTAMSLLICGGL
jgi:MFS family permease